MSTRQRPKKYCIVRECTRNDFNSDASFFCLPADEERRRQWLTTVDRLDLLKKEHCSFKNYRICSAHFERSEIINTVRRELTKEAIPKVACEIVPFHQDKATQYETNTAEEVVASTSRRRKLTAKAKDTKFYGMIKFKKRRKIKSCVSSQDLIDEVTRRSRKLAEFLKKMKKNRLEYKLFVLNFRYSNPNAYKCLETILNLPSQSTLNKLKINILPKIDDRVLKILELKMKSLPENAKFCTICVNSMTLKRHLYYDIKNDEIIGVQNVNGQVMADTANDAYIIMLQGIVVEWELPIAYALLGTRENDYGTWLKEIISKLSAIGIEVTAIISSQRSNFTDLAKKYEPKARKPYFAFNNLKLFCIFDVLHEIKCICNSLLTCDFYYDGKRISWDYIKQLYEDQKDQVKNLRLIPKITEKHVSSTDVDSDDTDFKEINFKYVAQIFSRSVSTALHTYVDLGKMPEEARTTAIFIETMNNVFDVLNSNKTNSNNKYQNAYSGNKDQEEILNDALQMFSLIRAVGRKASKTVKNVFGNIQISIQSIKMLFNDLQKKGIKYIFTRRLNQETLEKFLNTIYQGCSCKKPTPILFQRAFSKLFVSNLVESIPYDKDGKGNGGIDITDALFKAEKMVEVNYKWSIMPPQKSKVYLDGETDYRIDLPEDTLLYISSYLLFKCNDKHKCPTLDAAFESLPDFNKFESDNKDSEFYGRMKLPCAEFVKYIEDLEVVFRDNFSVVERNPGGYLYELVKAVVPQYEPCPCFPFDYLLRLFVRLRIFARLKSNNNLIRELERKKNYSFKKM